ncbi:MAG: glycosyltransferase [Thermoguttaceae bacterium]
MTHRILHVIPTLDRSGAEKQLSLLARGLPREEFEVHVCALTRGGPLEAELRAAGIPVTVIGKRWKIDPLAFARLRRLVLELRPDVIHTWLFAANAYGRAAGIACDVQRMVAGERCVDTWKRPHELLIDRYLSRRTARIVTNSPGVQEFYAAHGLPAEKFEVISNGIPPAPAPNATRSRILAELGLPDPTFLIGVIGRLAHQKRVKDAIWAVDLLRVFRKDVHLLIVGDGPHRPQLERFSDLVTTDNYVHFLGHRSDVPRLLPHFDLLWSPSAFEGQSNSVMEAMAAGVPVVATDIPGTRDLVVHGETGYLIPTRGRAAQSATVNETVARGLAKYTNDLLNDREKALRMGAAGRQRMLEQFSVPHMVAQYAVLYRRLLGPTE